jgi:hypothetical protein
MFWWSCTLLSNHLCTSYCKVSALHEIYWSQNGSALALKWCCSRSSTIFRLFKLMYLLVNHDWRSFYWLVDWVWRTTDGLRDVHLNTSDIFVELDHREVCWSKPVAFDYWNTNSRCLWHQSCLLKEMCLVCVSGCRSVCETTRPKLKVGTKWWSVEWCKRLV